MKIPAWEQVKEKMLAEGWTCDLDTEEKLYFSLIDGPHHWMRDYNKITKSFVQYDGNQKVNLKYNK